MSDRVTVIQGFWQDKMILRNETQEDSKSNFHHSIPETLSQTRSLLIRTWTVTSGGFTSEASYPEPYRDLPLPENLRSTQYNDAFSKILYLEIQ